METGMQKKRAILDRDTNHGSIKGPSVIGNVSDCSSAYVCFMV